MSEGREGEDGLCYAKQGANSDACAGEGAGLGEDDDAAFTGDVAFH